jgi:hypothetical protein
MLHCDEADAIQKNKITFLTVKPLNRNKQNNWDNRFKYTPTLYTKSKDKRSIILPIINSI